MVSYLPDYTTTKNSDPAVVVDGFVIRKASHGIYIKDVKANPTIANNTFDSCWVYSTGFGGSGYPINMRNCYPSVINNTVTKSEFTSAIFVDNPEGISADRQISVQGNVLENNVFPAFPSSYARGVEISGSVYDCSVSIQSNKIQGMKNGIAVAMDLKYVRIHANTLLNNTVGILSSCKSNLENKIYNNLIAHNVVGVDVQYASATLQNNTICKNETELLCEQLLSDMHYSNNISYGNTVGINNDNGKINSRYITVYSSFHGNNSVGNVMITRTCSSADPLFVGNTSLPVGVTTSEKLIQENWGLKSNSPAIDFGTPEKVDYDYDLQKNIRLIGLGIDCGAYEFSGMPLFVSPAGSGDKKGSSWANALDGNSIDATSKMTKLNILLRTLPNNSVVFLKAGDYIPSADVSGLNDTLKHFIIRRNVHIYGGFAGREQMLHERCDTVPSRFTAKETNEVIKIESQISTRIDKIELSGTPWGVNFIGAVKFTASHCVFKGFSNAGIGALSMSGGNIYAYLYNNKFSNCANAIAYTGPNDFYAYLYADHNLFANNTTAVSAVGGALDGVFSNNTLVNNILGLNLDSCVLRSFDLNIFWNNGANFRFIRKEPTIRYCLAQGETVDGTRYLAGDPQFVAPNFDVIGVRSDVVGDWRLKACSPAVDPTNTNAATAFKFYQKDMYGTAPYNQVDIGAFEYKPSAPTTKASMIWEAEKTNTSAELHWTKGNGCERIVLVKTAGTSYAAPMPNKNDVFSYNTTFETAGTQVSTSGWYCVYKGDGDKVTVTGLNPGSKYWVKVLESNPGGYYQSGEATGNYATISMPKLSQIITFLPIKEVVYKDTVLTLSASSSIAALNSTIMFKSNNPRVAKIVGNKLTVVGVGYATISAISIGNAAVAFDSVGVPFVVRKAASKVELALSPASLVYKLADTDTLSATRTPNKKRKVTYRSTNPNVAIVIDSVMTILSAGETYIIPSVAEDSLYEAAEGLPQLLTVKKASQTITFNPITSKIFGDADFALTASSDSTLSVNFTSSDTSILSIAAGVAFIKKAGTVKITAKQAGNDNYLPATDVTQTITIGKATQSIDLTTVPQTKTYGDATFALPYSATPSGLPITYVSSNANVISVSGNIASVVGVGSADITAKCAASNNYLAAADVKKTIIVSQASQIIEFGTLANKTYGEADFSLPATTKAGLTISYSSSNIDVVSIAGNIVTINGVGKATITATQAGNTNVKAAIAVSQNIEITPASQIISFAKPADKTFGDADFVLTAKASSGLAVSYVLSNDTVLSIVGNTASIIGAGTVEITAIQSGDANYNKATDIKQTITVSQASQKILFGTLDNKTYGDADFTLPATSTAGLAISYKSSDLNIVSIAGNIVTINGAGTATITASQAGNDNITKATDVSQKITIEQASQTISFTKPADKTFGDADFLLSAKASSGLTVSYVLSTDSVLSIAGNIVHILGEGTCTIKAVQSGNGNYLKSDTVSYIIKVSPKSQAISMKAFASVVYDTTLRIVPQVTCESNGAVTFESDNAAVVAITADNRIKIVGVGTATITATQAGAKNYLSTKTTATITVVKAPQSISFVMPAQVTFGGIAPRLEASASSGLEVAYSSNNEAVAKVVNGVLTIEGTGKATITATQMGNNNYEAGISVARELTVTKATQTITFAALPSFSYRDTTITPQVSIGSGLEIALSSDNASVAIIVDGKIQVVGAGTARITASQAGNDNYWAAAQVTQVLVIDRLEQSITLTAPATEVVYGQATIDLHASATSGLGLVYATSNSKVAKAENGKLEITGVGTATITISTVANDNYKPAQTSFTIVVKQASQKISFTPIADRSIADGDVFPVVEADSKLQVSLQSNNTSVAKIENGIIKIVGTGTVTITASQAGNTNYLAAKDSSVTFTVLKTTQSIIYTTLPTVVIGETKTLTLDGFATSKLAVSYTSSNEQVATIKDNILTIVGVGNAIITASQAGDGNYEAAGDKQQVLTVLKMSQEIVFDSTFVDTVEFNNQLLTINDVSDRGLTISYRSSNESVAVITAEGKVKIVGAGITLISAHQNGNATVDAAKPKEHRLVVTERIQSITVLSNAVVEYGSKDFELLIEGNKSTVTLQSQTPNVVQIVNGKLHVVGVDTALIRITQEAVAGYKAIDTVIKIIVTKAKDSVYFKPLANKLVGQQSFRLFASSKSGQAVTYSSSNSEIASVTENEVTINAAGQCEITASVAESDNYKAAATAQTFTVSAMDVLKLPAYTITRDTVIDLNSLRLNADTIVYSFIKTTHDKFEVKINNSLDSIKPKRSASCWTGVDTLWFKAVNKTTASDSVTFGIKITRKRFADQIGLVTTDSLTGTYNIVAWEPKYGANTVRWIVCRRSQSLSQWENIDTVQATELSYSVDMKVNTRQQPYQYALKTVDSLGCISDESEYHTTMHLKSGVSLQGLPQLWWSPYQGYDVDAYVIYRHNSLTNQYDSIGSTFLTSFTDVNPTGTANYRVAIRFPKAVRPFGLLKNDSGPFSQSMSNLSEAIILSTVGVSDGSVSLTPNPVVSTTTLTLPDAPCVVTITDAKGTQVLPVIYASGEAVIDASSLSQGTYTVSVESGGDVFILSLVKI